MKIIGYTSGGYLIEASPNEIATISGNQNHNTHGSRYSGRGDSNLPVGTTIEVAKTWTALSLIVKSQDERIRAAKQLHSLAEVLEAVPNPIILPEEEPPQPPTA